MPLSRAASSSAISLSLAADPVGRLLDGRRERFDGHRGVHHQQQRLESGAELGVVELGGLGDVDAQIPSRSSVQCRRRRLVDVSRCLQS